MKSLIKRVARLTWRRVVKPVVRMLPHPTGDRIETWMHYTKLTLVNGHTISFRQLEAPTVSEATCKAPSTRAEATFGGAGERDLLPAWVLEEMRELADIEPSLFPRPELVGSFQRYVTPLQSKPGELYAECYPAIRDLRPDVIILVPWLKHGGADQGILHHASAVVAEGKAVLIIATLSEDSPWSSRLPEGAVFLPFGKLAQHLPADTQRTVLARILLQSAAKTIHLINSPQGWDVVRHHGKSFRAMGKAIFASVFCDDYDSQGVRWSYADLYFPSCLPYLDGIFCDTRSYPKELVRRFGVNAEIVHTLYFPHALTLDPHYRAVPSRSILWAGRFSRQKRVDLLERIAAAMPDVQFAVHGCGSSPEELVFAKRLAALGNVTVSGSFDSLHTLVTEGRYAAFLYTSAWDGLPIVLLDATVAGLPIVASSVGGVGEFVSGETGILVEEPDEVDAYVRGLRLLIDDPKRGRELWEQAVNLLAGRHATESFRAAVGAIRGYLN
ncbi:glycosyltransferase family 4 protein [Cupriavidus necator]